MNAPYREKKVIYCILNPQLPFQTVRISKGFLSDGRPATDIAKNNPDSILYKPEDILVELIEETSSKTENKKWMLSPFIITSKDSGTFYFPDQLLYKTADIELDTLTLQTQKYKIRVTNKITNQVSEASSNLVGRNFRIRNPFLENPGDPLVFRFSTRNKTEVKIDIPTNAALIEASLSWNIRVVKEANGIADTATETWQMSGPGFLGIAQSSTQANGAIGPGNFWRFLQDEVVKRGNANVKNRKILGGQMLVSTANNEYSTYKEVNGNYNPITQSTPIYTNVSNGLGVVCSINQRTFKTLLDLSVRDSVAIRVPEFKLIK